MNVEGEFGKYRSRSEMRRVEFVKQKKLTEAEQIILDFMLADIEATTPEMERLKNRAREFLNGRLEGKDKEAEEETQTQSES